MRKPKGSKIAKTAKSAKRAPKDGVVEVLPETAPEKGPEPGLAAQADPEPAAAKVTEPAAETAAEPVDETAAEAADKPAATPVFAPEEPLLDAVAPDDRAHDDPAHDEEHGHRTLAATALMVLVGVIFIASLTLWAAPKLAPSLPAGVAQYLMPGQIDSEARFADLNDAMAAGAAKSETAIAGMATEIAALGARLEAAADASQTEAALAAAQSAADAAAAEAAALTARLDAIEAGLAALGDEFATLSTALAAAGAEEGATSSEIAAAVAALGARLDSLAKSVDGGGAAEALEARIATLAARLDTVESSAADARDVQSEALDEVSSTIRQARLQAAVDLLTSRLTGGLPYAAKLDEIAALTGTTPPDALATGAGAGLATAAALEASFSRHAQAAVAADVQAGAGEGTGLQALGWLRAQVAGRPVAETEGAGAGAVTSRIAARVGEGKLAEALAEAGTLSEPARAGLGVWLDRLRARVAADAALADWRARSGAGG